MNYFKSKHKCQIGTDTYNHGQEKNSINSLVVTILSCANNILKCITHEEKIKGTMVTINCEVLKHLICKKAWAQNSIYCKVSRSQNLKNPIHSGKSQAKYCLTKTKSHAPVKTDWKNPNWMSLQNKNRQ